MGVSKNKGYPQNGWFIMENPINPIKMGWFGGTIIFGNNQIEVNQIKSWDIMNHHDLLQEAGDALRLRLQPARLQGPNLSLLSMARTLEKLTLANFFLETSEKRIFLSSYCTP